MGTFWFFLMTCPPTKRDQYIVENLVYWTFLGRANDGTQAIYDLKHSHDPCNSRKEAKWC